MIHKKFRREDIVVVMALPSESQNLFEKAGIEVHYCGIGKVNAAIGAAQIIFTKKPQLILNLGTAGSHKFKTHDLIECSSYVQKDMDISPLGFKRGETPMDEIPGLIKGTTLTQLKKGVCGTGDTFEVGVPGLECDLVDMEAYSLAKACKKLSTQFMAIKYITDGSDPESHKDWVANLPKAAAGLLNAYHSLVE